VADQATTTDAQPSDTSKEKTKKIIAGLAVAGGGPRWGRGPGWGGPGPVGWAPPPPPGPIPGGWNGGWEPNGGLCLFDLCG
jgi:hypothetical protein